MPCLDENVVLDIAAGRARLDTLADVERHLATCSSCASLVGQAARSLDRESPRADGRASDSAPASRVLAPGTLLKGTYEIIRPIGSGGMGEVYEATHQRLAGRYAVKVLRRELSAEPTFISRFQREAKITSSLQHPHIVQVIDFDSAPDGSAFLVMEFLEGADLATILGRSGPMDVPRMLLLVQQIASALTAAHRLGIVHRDLKPHNVFVLAGDEAEERVKLVDFGLSKWSGHGPLDGATLSQKNVVLGTPRYMAPEQALSRHEETGPASDQFALAAMVYEMLAGAPAFPGNTLAEVIHSVAFEKPIPIEVHRPDLAADLCAAIARALAKRPAERFPSVRDFAEALEQTGNAARRRASPSRRRAGFAAIAVAGAALALGGAIFVARRPSSVVPRSAAPLAAPSAVAKPVQTQVTATMEAPPLDRPQTLSTAASPDRGPQTRRTAGVKRSPRKTAAEARAPRPAAPTPRVSPPEPRTPSMGPAPRADLDLIEQL